MQDRYEHPVAGTLAERAGFDLAVVLPTSAFLDAAALHANSLCASARFAPQICSNAVADPAKRD
jgi:hypothetical protein